MRHPREDLQPTAEQRQFITWLLEQSQLDVERYRWPPLLRRVSACLRAIHVESIGAAREALQANPALLADAVDALIIGVTSFYRDQDIFDYLCRHVLPQYASGRPRIWCAACSKGAELHTLAILLADLGQFQAHYLGSDCRAIAIERARQGVYKDEEVEDLDRRLHDRWMRKVAAGFQVAQPVRQCIQWSVADVFSCRDVAWWDLILCRNLAIYLEPRASKQLWQVLIRALRPGGVLVVGKAEKPAELPGQLIRIAPSIYRRQGSH